MIRLEEFTTYTFEFDYRVMEMPKNNSGVPGYFYFLCRSKRLGYSYDKGYAQFGANDRLGAVYHKSFTVTTGMADDYYFILGMFYVGEIIVDNVKITKVN